LIAGEGMIHYEAPLKQSAEDVKNGARERRRCPERQKIKKMQACTEGSFVPSKEEERNQQ